MLPQQLIKSLKSTKGFDEKAFVAVHASGEQVTSIRLNPLKPFEIHDSTFLIQGDVPWCTEGKYLSERPSFTLDPLFHAGAYYVQEASSMFLQEVLEQTAGKETSGLKVLDLCAAPGGKSTLLASYFKDGLLVSNEVIKARAAVLVENISKWGADNVIVTNNDPRDFAALPEYFDVIVADAPCSGSGLFRKDPESVNEWSEEAVMHCSQRQQRILADIYPALKKDGLLIYSTCSYSHEEDEAILGWLSKQFSLAGCRLLLDKDWNIVETATAEESYGYRFYPDKIKGEGFFIAAFRKTDGENRIMQVKSLVQPATKQEAAIAKDWLIDASALFFFKQAETIIAIAQKWKEDLAFIQKQLYLRKAGTAIGVLKGNDLVPHHELALSLLVKREIPSAEVDKVQALQYLRRKDIMPENVPKGWLAIRYCGINLGWVKVLHNRINNYYPVNWRILKD